MFVRAKKSGRYEYLQVVQNERVDGRVRQRVIATLGRVDQLQEEGHVDALLSSCSRFAQNVAVMDAHKRGALPPVKTVKIGPPLAFERLWRQRKVKDVLEQLLRGCVRSYQLSAISQKPAARAAPSRRPRSQTDWSAGSSLGGPGRLGAQSCSLPPAAVAESLTSVLRSG